MDPSPRHRPFAPVLRAACAAACLLALAAGCQRGPDPGPRGRVLILADGGTENAMLAALGAAGWDTVRGGPWYEGLGRDADGIDVVVLPCAQGYDHRMPPAEQERLVRWVAGGGGLVVTEWFHYYATRNAVLAGILPVGVSNRYAYAAQTLHPAAAHELAGGLPDAIVTGPDWTQVVLEPDTTAAKQARVAVFGADGEPAVVTGRHGRGHIVSWGMAGNYDGADFRTPAVDRLLVRIVAWAGG
ncbi:hypothetical protein KDM41_05395 [bacterium]|nr:hypothetical protein [bacterium]